MGVTWDCFFQVLVHCQMCTWSKWFRLLGTPFLFLRKSSHPKGLLGALTGTTHAVTVHKC